MPSFIYFLKDVNPERWSRILALLFYHWKMGRVTETVSPDYSPVERNTIK